MLVRKLAVLLLACVAGLTGAVAPPVASASAANCSMATLPVTAPSVVPLFDTPAVISGQLCLPDGPAPTAVQLLVHGGTYNRTYWDLPYLPDQYSYQRDMAKHGYATFAVDVLGAGQSSHPLSLPLTVWAEAEAMHEVVGQLRTGAVGGIPFGKVVIVGHSVGSGIVASEASTYKDVDGVVLTGVTHIPSVPALGLGAALGLVPAFLSSVQNPGDPLYFTTRPGARGPLFYNSADADPSVIAADEATKDQVSVPGMGTVAVFGIVVPVTLGIDVPVLQAVGQDDILFCGLLALRDCSSASALRAQELPFYSSAAWLSVYVLPNAGHSIALHENAGDYRDATRAWLGSMLGF
ncbi:alpha/beta fold hydrolase [Kutzneria buriramensis]|uniref:Alpha-beta hydrolase superfamily lysophospholipase n=1 Tax=Kutzneria buriramensis TaxID=1045776 RepID=A0A3E0H1F0_9PSEU|nr:alpha/beta fold hydrolase [Kutzneria buriramensis]REH35383.1 alpha-beta hydrolase superfamily lysophospholipase [Kutzneria buriramensis]